MALNKKDLGQIKGAIKETILEAMGSEPIKKVLKETILEVMEPMMVASQKEFVKIDGRFDKIGSKVDNLEATLKNQYPNKDYLTDKLGDLAAEIGARIDRKKKDDEEFKRKVIEILKRNSLVEKEEILFLEKLI